MGNKKVFQTDEERVICEKIMKEFNKKAFSFQKDIDPEIKAVLTNDFFNKLMDNETTD